MTEMQGQGWHPDPHGGNHLRWWDGAQWSDHTHPLANEDPPGVGGPIAPRQHEGQGEVVSAAGLGGAGEQQTANSDPGWLERTRVSREHQRLLAETEQARSELAVLRTQLVETEDAVLLQEAGVYSYRHPLDDAVAYKAYLNDTKARMKSAVREDHAIQSPTGWTVNGSQVEGRKMVRDFSKLMLNAYNAEADALVRSLKPYALDRAIERLDKTATKISKLGLSMGIAITTEYHRLRCYELELTADHISKVADERERDREERALLREEQKVLREYEREREKLRKELEHRTRVLAGLRARGVEGDELARAESELDAVESSLAGLSEREANTRAGYVYVISNVGAFGPGVVKVGMTRRLDPMDRVRELGDASVPFRFDVHAIVFSNDAVGLESSLHSKLSAGRLNRVNLRREFFYATPAAVRDLLEEAEVNLLEFVEEPEALEWHQSRNAMPELG